MVDVRPQFRSEDWAAYQDVNVRFAAAIDEELAAATTPIFIHDYHLALVAPALYFAINFTEGYFVTPTIVGRRLTLNPVVVFVGIDSFIATLGTSSILLALTQIVSDQQFIGPIPDSLQTFATWQLAGVSVLCGIGFTMSLFVGNLAFGGREDLLTATKVGILLASLVSGVAGGAILVRAKRVDRES